VPKTWPEDLDAQTKLWEMEADLRSRAQFVISTDVVEAKKKLRKLSGF
jgi:hypothetical protein